MKQRIARINQHLRAYDLVCKLARKKQFAELRAFFELVGSPTKKQRNQQKIMNIVKPLF